MTRGRVASLLAAALLAAPASSVAQTPSPAKTGRLVVTVADQTGGVIPNATVRVTGESPAAVATADPVTAATSGSGTASIDLAPGRYRIHAEFPGFDAVDVADVRIKNGETKRTVVLPLSKVEQTMTVGRDGQSAALDPLGKAFSTVLTRDQIDALPDDPDEMAAMLKQMAPPGSTIRVDGFSGGRLPPKSQIKSIRLPRMDMLAAQNHGGMSGVMFIDIQTQPGEGPLQGSTDFTFRNQALNARNPFTPTKGDEGVQQYGFGLSGALVPGKTGFSLSLQGAKQFDDDQCARGHLGWHGGPTRAAAGRSLQRHRTRGQRRGRRSDLHFYYQGAKDDQRNLGVGGFNLPETAYSRSCPTTWRGSRRAVRSAGMRSPIATAIALGGQRGPVGSRRADHPRQRRVHDRRRAAGRRHTRGRGRSGL